MREIDPNVFGKVQFSRVPDGVEPFGVRRDWLAVIEVKCLYFDDDACSAHTTVSGERLPPYPAYIVSQRDALEALANVSPIAAWYYRRAGYPKGEGACFGFDPSCVKIVKPVVSRVQFERLRLSCMDS